MRTIIKPATLLIALGLLAGASFAQRKDESTTGKDKTIVIRPDSKEKYTIVVDGDKVTVNGKPVDEFDSRDLTITRKAPSARRYPSPSSPLMKGGWNILTPEGVFAGNKALLGVVTEEADSGARVKEVSKESAAEKAGLKEGDVITKINDTKIETPESLHKAIGALKPEDKVTITYHRSGKERQTTAILSKNTVVADIPGLNYNRGNFIPWHFKPQDFESLDFQNQLRNFNSESRKKPKLGIQIQDRENGKGVRVTDITEAGAAFKAGLKQEDIITAVNGKSVNTVADVKKELAAVKEGGELSITYLRNSKSQTATIKFPKKLEKADL